MKFFFVRNRFVKETRDHVNILQFQVISPLYCFKNLLGAEKSLRKVFALKNFWVEVYFKTFTSGTQEGFEDENLNWKI